MKTLKSLFVALLFFSYTNTHASIVTWIGGNGNWDVDSNWDTGQKPDADDGVIIPSGTVLVDNFAQANFIHLDGGDLEVQSSGMIFLQPDQGWYGPTNQLRGMVIENGSNFENSGSTFIIKSFDSMLPGIMIYCDGYMINQANAFMYLQGDDCTGIHSYTQSTTIFNYGHVVATGLKLGLYLLRPFKNYGILEVGAEDIGIYNRSTVLTGSSSFLQTNGRIENAPGSNWTQYGETIINYSSPANTAPLNILGFFEVMNGSVLTVEGMTSPINIHSSGTFRNRGVCNFRNSTQFKHVLTNYGFFVNHQNGVINSDGYYGVGNGIGAEI